jgi:flagellar basal-body rod protein FlgB
MSTIFGSVSPLHQALDYHLSRQNILTTNLTQVDTPGFKAQDLVREGGEFGSVLQIEMAASAPGHYGTPGGTAEWHVARDVYAPVGADGNSVSLDRETVKIASNNLRYDAISTMVKGALDNLDWAVRDGK